MYGHLENGQLSYTRSCEQHREHQTTVTEVTFITVVSFVGWTGLQMTANTSDLFVSRERKDLKRHKNGSLAPYN